MARGVSANLTLNPQAVHNLDDLVPGCRVRGIVLDGRVVAPIPPDEEGAMKGVFVEPTAVSAREIRDMEMGSLRGGNGALSGPVEGCILVILVIVVATSVALVYD